MNNSAADSQGQEPAHFVDILRGSGVTMLGTLTGGAMALLGEILIARLLGVAAYGLFSIAYVLARIFNRIALSGLGPAVVHFIVIHRNQGQTARVIGTTMISLAVPLAIGTIAMALLMLFSNVVAGGFFKKPDAAIYIYLVAAAIPFMVIAELLALICRALGHSGYFVLVSAVIPPAIVLVGASIIRSLGASGIWICSSVVAAYATATMVGTILVGQLLGSDLWRTRPICEFRQLYGYALPILASTLLYSIMDWADVVLLGRFVRAEDVGIYRACIQILMVFDIIIFGVNASALHIVPVLDKHGLHEQQNRTFRLITLLAFCASTPVFFVLSLHARSILALLGANFTAGATVLVMLGARRLIRNGLGSAAFLLTMTGRQRFEFRNALAGTAVNVLFCIALIPPFGVYGAAVGATFGEIVLNGMRARQVGRHMRIQVPYGLLVRVTLVGGLTAACIVGVDTLLGTGDVSSPFALLARAAAEALVLALSLWVFGIEDVDRTAFFALFRQLMHARGLKGG